MFSVPRVGVATVFFNPAGQILLGHRICEHGNDTWSVPGGHLELFETPYECGVREASEEVGVTITDMVEDGYTNDFFFDTNKHYITLFFKVIDYVGDIVNLEPDKCDEWRWFDMDELPSNLLEPLREYLYSK